MSVKEDNRVRSLLVKLHGVEPKPLRCYLVYDEVDRLMLEGGYLCLCSTHDLEIRGYQGKWRQAVEEQVRDGRLNHYNAEFWLNARRAFIELGGSTK